MRQCTQDVDSLVKFRHDRYIVSPLRGEKSLRRNTAAFDQIFNLGLLYPPHFTNHGQVWQVIVAPQCTLPHQIFTQSVCIGLTIYNRANLNVFGIFVGPVYPLPFNDHGRFGLRLQCKRRPKRTRSLLAKFHPDRFTISPLRGEKPRILPILNFNILWWHHIAAQRQS